MPSVLFHWRLRWIRWKVLLQNQWQLLGLLGISAQRNDISKLHGIWRGLAATPRLPVIPVDTSNCGTWRKLINSAGDQRAEQKINLWEGDEDVLATSLSDARTKEACVIGAPTVHLPTAAWHDMALKYRDTYRKHLTGNSSGDEIANVTFFTTTSYTYYKTQ